jgi:hypothetical protein
LEVPPQLRAELVCELQSSGPDATLLVSMPMHVKFDADLGWSIRNSEFGVGLMAGSGILRDNFERQQIRHPMLVPSRSITTENSKAPRPAISCGEILLGATVRQ